MELLGCSIPNFIIYLESTFEPGMSWELFHSGEIQLDHIIPVALFDMSKASHQKRCFHFSNHQLLWKADNQTKGKRIFVGPDYLRI